MEKNIEISILYDLYSELLTKNQREILDDFYNFDLSLSEIAENNEITRQAVRDILKVTEKKLFNYESKLKLMEKVKEKDKIKKQIILELDNIKNKENTKTIKQILKNINSL